MTKIYQIILVTFLGIWTTLASWVPKVKMYYIENTKIVSREDAKANCQELGMHLLTVKSRIEFDTLKEHLRSQYAEMYPYWIGAYKRNETWIWDEYEEVIEPSKQFWHTGEPNSAFPKEICAHTVYGEFGWNDNHCEGPQRYICELQLDTPSSVVSFLPTTPRVQASY
ncbi:E-selectin-like [Stomoxys calcitrans]|uniref:C-type lectin domain-containing protein n=1 Tax=Stomoxys calcitrans TaxID=35570 RepID=A0A1I8Q3J7_STOCA|nr:E-selectin-like [Stomoxys calcitrans]